MQLERWLAVCRPLQVRLKLSERRTKQLIVLVFLLALLYNLPRFFEYEKKCWSWKQPPLLGNQSQSLSFNSSGSGSGSSNRSSSSSFRPRTCTWAWSRSAVGEHVVYSYLYGIGAYTVVIFLLPVSTILALNAHLFWEIRRHNVAMKDMSLSQRIERKISKMPFCTAVVFCVFETPVTVVNVVESCGLLLNGRMWAVLTAVSSVLMLAKASSNLLLYFFCASQFRTTLRDLFVCCGVPPTSRRVSAVSQCSFALHSLIVNQTNGTTTLLHKRSSSTFSTMVMYERANEQIT